jgi:hypothetical protein
VHSAITISEQTSATREFYTDCGFWHGAGVLQIKLTRTLPEYNREHIYVTASCLNVRRQSKAAREFLAPRGPWAVISTEHLLTTRSLPSCSEAGALLAR